MMKKDNAKALFDKILEEPNEAQFDTANGRISSKDRVEEFLDQLPGQVKPWLLESTPSALSLGKRSVQDGFDFVWKRFEQPFLVRPDGTISPLKVDGVGPGAYVGCTRCDGHDSVPIEH